MSDKTTIRGHWKPITTWPTMNFRWLAKSGTTTEPKVLQQAWQRSTGEFEWRDVPTEVKD